MNINIFTGRVTDTPEISATTGADGKQHEKAKFSIAVQRTFKNAEGQYDADFVNITAFGAKVQAVQNLSKGRRVNVVCHYQSGSYINQEGKKVYTSDFILDNLEFGDSKPQEGGAQPQQMPMGQSQQMPMGQPQQMPMGQPQQMPMGQPQQMPMGQPQQMPMGQPQQMPMGQPQQIPMGQPQQMPMGQPQQMPMGQPQQMPSIDQQFAGNPNPQAVFANGIGGTQFS